MNFGPDNFLTAIKFLVTGGGLGADGRAKLDAGYSKDMFDLLGDSLLLTSNTYVADAAGFPVISTAASATNGPVIPWYVPRDYDEKTDRIVLSFVVNSGGATDVPTITVTPKLKVIGSAAVTLTAQTTAAISATETRYTMIFSGAGVKRNNELVFTFTTGAHTTDVIQYRAIGVTYLSTLVSYNQVDTTTTPPSDLR